MTRLQESRAIRAALAPETLADFDGRCHIASVRLVENSETDGTALSKVWRRARVGRGTHKRIFGGHSWVVVDEKRIVDVTLWHYDRSVEPIHRTSIDDPAYREDPDA